MLVFSAATGMIGATVGIRSNGLIQSRLFILLLMNLFIVDKSE